MDKLLPKVFLRYFSNFFFFFHCVSINFLLLVLLVNSHGPEAKASFYHLLILQKRSPCNDPTLTRLCCRCSTSAKSYVVVTWKIPNSLKHNILTNSCFPASCLNIPIHPSQSSLKLAGTLPLYWLVALGLGRARIWHWQQPVVSGHIQDRGALWHKHRTNISG